MKLRHMLEASGIEPKDPQAELAVTDALETSKG